MQGGAWCEKDDVSPGRLLPWPGGQRTTTPAHNYKRKGVSMTKQFNNNFSGLPQLLAAALYGWRKDGDKLYRWTCQIKILT